MTDKPQRLTYTAGVDPVTNEPEHKVLVRASTGHIKLATLPPANPVTYHSYGSIQPGGGLMDTSQPMADLREEAKPKTDGPKFFLHDEMIYWLQNNLQLYLSTSINKYSSNVNDQNDVGLTVTISIGGQHITGNTVLIKNAVTSDVVDNKFILDNLKMQVIDQQKKLEELEQVILTLSEQLRKK